MTTTTTSTIGTRRGMGMVLRVRRLVLVAGSLLAAIASRWNDIVESGQLGEDYERTISRQTGGRI